MDLLTQKNSSVNSASVKKNYNITDSKCHPSVISLILLMENIRRYYLKNVGIINNRNRH